jgi:FlaA1/EpsC-like NDP-sugar epimerase
VQEIFRAHRPGIVLHAAAHKHVPLMEEQPLEAYRNNVLGTAVATRAAAAHGTERFVLISTDKAVNPAGVMGATKRLAEKLTHAAQNTRCNCVFSVVRFGNVLGSSGSVVPVFHRQIAAGGPVTVTDPGATRFFMTIPEAAGLILQSALLAEGGETFLLEMGAPVKIEALARQMIELAGFVPGRDIGIRYTGLRPGEKLHEETVLSEETTQATKHPQIKRVAGSHGAPFDAGQAASFYGGLAQANPETVRRRILTAGAA